MSFVSEWLVAVQQREPAAISFYDVRTRAVRNTGTTRLELVEFELK